MNAQQSAVFSILQEIDLSSPESIEKEIARLKKHNIDPTTSPIGYISKYTIKDGKREYDLDDPMIKIAGQNAHNLVNHIRRSGGSPLILSYLYAYNRLSDMYDVCSYQSPVYPTFYSEPITDDVFETSVMNSIKDMIKDRFKINADVKVSANKCIISMKYGSNTVERSFPISISKNTFSFTYVECMFCHMCNELKDAVLSGSVVIDNSDVREKVLSLLVIYSLAYI